MKPTTKAHDEGCEDEHCPGWLVDSDLKIQRCDTCDVFKDDVEATEVVLDWLHNEWVKNDTRARMRRETRPK